ncbi:hypothetical protein KJ582_03535 [bacterium]|nr:hypothetical protein [bacterium]
MTKKMYAVVHLFQGTVHEVTVYYEWDIAREAADKKIIEAYGELVEEQCGDDEIILEEAKGECVVTKDTRKGILLDKAEVRAALTDRMEQDDLSVKPNLYLDKRTDDFYLFIEDALTGFLDDQYNLFKEEEENRR